MIRFTRRDSLPRSSIKRLLSQPALAAGLALLLASAAPAGADFFGNLDQLRIEDADAGPAPAAKARRNKSGLRWAGAVEIGCTELHRSPS